MTYNKTSQTITVAVTAYNVAPYLKRCVQSILNQTYPNLEVLIVNDGSSDETAKLLDEVSRTDSRISLISQENHGISYTRNTCLSNASGDWLLFVDGDDYLPDDAVELLFKAAVDNNADMSVGGHILVSPNGKESYVSAPETYCSSSEESQLYFLTQGNNNLFPWGKLYSRKLYQKMHYEEGKIYEDVRITPFLLDLAKTVYIIDKPVYYYCLRPQSITYGQSISKQAEGLEAVLTYEQYIKEHYPSYSSYAAKKVISFCLYVMGKICESGRKTHPDEWNMAVTIAKEHLEHKEITGLPWTCIRLAVGTAPVLTGNLCHMYSRIRNGL